MKRFNLLFLLLVFCQDAQPPCERYIIFLHNRFIEDHGPLEQHPSYGRAEYDQILQRFRKDGFIVISERRPVNTDQHKYAIHVISQIDSLQNRGVPSAIITIVGTSKGGNIAQDASCLSRNPGLNFVFIGSSFKILLHTNLHHGFLFKALDAWILPTERWAYR